MRLTRRQLIAGGTVAGFGAAGIYELVVRIGAAQAEQRRSTFFTVVE